MEPSRRPAPAAPDPWAGAPPSWTDLPDALLQRAAAGAGRDPDSLAGLRILDDAAARVVEQLSPRAVAPSLDGDGLIEAARARFVDSLSEPTIFAQIVQRARLDHDSAEVFALLCAIELDRRRQRLVAYVQDDVTKPRPTLELIGTLLGEAGLASLTEDSPLRIAALVRLGTDGPWASHEVTVPPVVLWALNGDASIDRALGPEIELHAVPTDHPARAPVDLAIVAGPDRTRRLQAGVLASPADIVLATPAPDDTDGWEALIRFATLHGLSVLVEAGEELTAAGRMAIERASHLAWCVSSKVELPVQCLPDRPWHELGTAPALATAEEVEQITDAGLGAGHRLTADQLRQLNRLLPAVDGDATAGVRRLGAGPLQHLARRIRPRRQRDELVLTKDQDDQLDELLSRYRQRDTVYGEWGVPAIPAAGVVAMFSGPSGTGKSSAAEIVANELGLDLFVVDVSAVVSKYIGETEKNLERIFDAAAAGNHVLLFDEADALFGKRTEVSDARDRYANIEVAYLLQRLETFDGLLLLTTNLARNIDNAFLRRVHVAIDFPIPDAGERQRIWKRWLATGAPVGEIDTDFLSTRFELAGGAISNTVLTAAFLAAEHGQSIDTRLVMRALRRELQKQGRLVTETDFGPYYADFEP